MSNCHDFGIFNGCQPHCPHLRAGECDTQREMVVTFILSGEWPIEEGSPCVEEGCGGNYQFVECNPCHPTACYTILECSECCEPAPSKEEIRKDNLARIERTSAAIKRLERLVSEPLHGDISTDKRLRKPVAAEELIPPSSVAKEVLPIHRAMSQARVQSPVRPWVPFWLGQD